MANSPDQFCGNCGNAQVPGQRACPHCGNPYGGTYSGPLGIAHDPTQRTPPDQTPHPSQPNLGNTPGLYSGDIPPVPPPPFPSYPGNMPPPQVSGVLPPVAPPPGNTPVGFPMPGTVKRPLP